MKSISLPDNLSEFPEFISCSKDLVITYKGHSFTKNDMYFIKYLSDGLDDLNCFIILSLQQDILQDDTFSPFLIKKLADAAHNKKLDSLAKRMKNNFQTIGFYEISDKIDAEMKEHLPDDMQDLVFLTQKASPVTRYPAEHALTDITKAIDINRAYNAAKAGKEFVPFVKLHPHALRHTFCSLYSGSVVKTKIQAFYNEPISVAELGRCPR